MSHAIAIPSARLLRSDPAAQAFTMLLVNPVPAVDTVTITKALYEVKRGSLSVEATSSATGTPPLGRAKIIVPCASLYFKSWVESCRPAS